MDERLNKIKSMYGKYCYEKKIYLVGAGAVGKPLLYLLLRLVKLYPNNITIIDKVNKPEDITLFTDLGVKFVHATLTKDTLPTLFKGIEKGDLIIDAAYNISTHDLVKFSQEKGCCYINSSIDVWGENDGEVYTPNPLENAIDHEHNLLFELNKKNINFNAVISMGCNPGNVSIWAKVGLDKINEIVNGKKKFESYAELAQNLGVEVVQISERDTQVTNVPKRINEYCNTWSSDGAMYYDEALACAEMTWGTHEKKLPNDVASMQDGFVVLNRMGIYTQAQTVVPVYGRYIGNIIKHDEAYTIGKTLELKKDNKVIYRPSVYYIYHPCDAGRMSIEELKERQYKYQKYWRILTDEIVSGQDILGVTYFLKNKKVYWVGSLLDINEARKIFDNKLDEWINATNVQVVTGYLTGIIHMIELVNNNKYEGMKIPDDLDHKLVMDFAQAFLGDFIFTEIKDFKLIKYDKNFINSKQEQFTNDWQFENFIIN
jgi:homospermidine synthase